MTEFMKEHPNKKNLLIWTAILSLAVCLVFSLFYLVQGTILSGPLEGAIWGVAILIILVGLGYNLELNMVKGYYRSYLGVGLLVTICGLAVGVISTILGFFGFVALVPISILIFILCLVFSPDFFSMDRLPFCLRLLASGLIVGAVVAIAFFLF
jgi:hypothetical protein